MTGMPERGDSGVVVVVVVGARLLVGAPDGVLVVGTTAMVEGAVLSHCPLGEALGADRVVSYACTLAPAANNKLPSPFNSAKVTRSWAATK